MAPERSSTSARPETEEPGYGSDSSSSSDSDPIIKRIPIYYASSYLHDVTLLQYLDRPPKPFTQHPLLPPSLRPEAEDPPVDTADIEIKARYKPNSRHMVMQVPIEKHETRFNVEAAERLGAGLIADAGAGKEKKKKKRGQDREEAEEDKPALLVEKILLESLVVPDVVNYAVGILRDDALYLTPVLQTYQLRPALTYLDELAVLDRRSKRAAALNSDDDSSSSEISETELKKLETKQVQVSVKQSADLSGGGAFGKSGGSGGGNGRAGEGLMEPVRAKEGEAWVSLQQCPVDSEASSDAYNYLFPRHDNMGANLTSLTYPLEYLKI